MKKKIAVFGSTVQDIFFSLDNITQMTLKSDQATCHYTMLEEGEKYKIHTIHYQLGGGGAHAALIFKKMNTAVFFQSTVGNDDRGSFLINALEKYGISTSNIIKKTGKTSFSMIFPNQSHDQPIISYDDKTNITEINNSLIVSLIENSIITYIAPLYYPKENKFDLIIASARINNSFIYINPSIAQIIDPEKHLLNNLHSIDAIQCNYKEAILLFDALKMERKHDQPSSLQDNFRLNLLCQFLLEKNIKIAIITNGKEGVYIAHQKKIYFFKMEPVIIKNTVGAGDTFGATFAHFFIKTNNIHQATELAVTHVISILENNCVIDGLLAEEILLKRQVTLNCTVFEL